MPITYKVNLGHSFGSKYVLRFLLQKSTEDIWIFYCYISLVLGTEIHSAHFAQCMYERDVRARVVFLILPLQTWCAAQWRRLFLFAMFRNNAQIYGQSWFWSFSLIKAVLRPVECTWPLCQHIFQHLSKRWSAVDQI